ncbi:MAG: MerR family transcriptional regulator [Caldilineaceae bacterium]|nr:MerR family transcriptional regulator [Caldilineaceae bacterium]
MSTANVATNRTFLYIKEVADLFGVTTKTVRHYHKIGLLPEPARSEADYRLYTGKDLWRLRTICELRRLGLPLAQIRTVLAAPDPADALRVTLATQLDVIETQLLSLAERKERIKQLMSQETLTVQGVSGEPELYVDQLLAEQAHLLPAKLDESLLQFEREMETMMAVLGEEDTRDESISPMIAYIEIHPEQYQQLMHDYNHVWQQLPTLESLNSASKEVITRRAAHLIEQNREIFQAFAQAQQPAPTEDSPTTAVLADVMNEQVQSVLTPAQLFFLQCLGAAADEIRAAS